MIDHKLIKILNEIAVMLELKGENPFKARAYSNAAEIIEEQGIDVAGAVASGEINNIKGFGDALTKKITGYVANGRMEYYEKLKGEVPYGLVEVTKIGGIGPKKAKMLFDSHKVENIDDLERLCIEDKLKNIKGFGAKSQEIIMNSIQHRKASRGRYLQQIAFEEAAGLLEEIRMLPGVVYAELTGIARRFAETISSLHFLVGVENPESFAAGKIDSGRLSIPAEFEICGSSRFYSMLNYTTGSDEYIKAFNEFLSTRNFVTSGGRIYLNDEEIFPSSEADLYKIAGLQYVPPELREGAGILQMAETHSIPELITDSDLKGMLHCHSTWSDGRNSIREMALKSKELGFSYFAICDHSQAAAYANGLSIERVMMQHEEIDRLNAEDLGIHILKGIESDILPDGSLDYPEEVLERFDLVVASVHSSFNMSKEAMTRRIICAVQSPYTTIIGHPTGRLLLARPAYEVDIREIIAAAADFGKIIEINSNPYRLDLSWEHLAFAREKCLRIAINPDSHAVDTLKDVFIGVKAARKGGLEAKDVVNCNDLDSFMKIIKK